MKTDAICGGLDDGLQIGAGAPLLVHNAHLERVTLEAEKILDRAEQTSASATSSGPCIFGFTI